MREIVWTGEARQNLIAIRAYIAQFSPLNAQRFSDKLVNAAEGLVEVPNRGRAVSGGRRELTAIWPYIIRYSVTPDKVIILRIKHGAQRPSSAV